MAINFGFKKTSSGVMTPAKKKQQKELFMLAAVLVVTIGVVIWGFGGGGDEPVAEEGFSSFENNESFLGEAANVAGSDYDLDRAFLEGEVFKKLESFGNHPVVVGELGVERPFLNIK